ncbi:MAG: glycosyltransferase, partial [Chloroflexi bacterium]|nr:glycosyltransferase [Chloroflexota bacterium]
PTVRKTQPSAHLYVVGKSPHRRLRGLSEDESVTVTGYVEDVLPYFRGADVYIAPFRVGGGTRLKILQALAAALPLDTTTVGTEGIAVVDGVHARVADDAATFARAVLSLAADREAARALGTAGRQLVANHYDWSAIIPQLEAIYRTL